MICSSVNRFFIAAPLWNGLYSVTVLNAGSRSLRAPQILAAFLIRPGLGATCLIRAISILENGLG
ncbi:hypothetical protein EYA82_34345 [Burkholderia pseudomallei]|nr:hypothetical protein EYA82_34345 [Burkholderia pseudomallei]